MTPFPPSIRWSDRSPEVFRTDGEGRGQRQRDVFNLGTIMDTCGASSTCEYTGKMCRTFFLHASGRYEEEPVPSVQDLPEFRSSNVIRSETDFLVLPDVPQVLRTRPRSGGPLAIAKNPPGPRPGAECASERIRKSVREPGLPILKIAGSLRIRRASFPSRRNGERGPDRNGSRRRTDAGRRPPDGPREVPVRREGEVLGPGRQLRHVLRRRRRRGATESGDGRTGFRPHGGERFQRRPGPHGSSALAFGHGPGERAPGHGRPQLGRAHGLPGRTGQGRGNHRPTSEVASRRRRSYGGFLLKHRKRNSGGDRPLAWEAAGRET